MKDSTKVLASQPYEAPIKDGVMSDATLDRYVGPATSPGPAKREDCGSMASAVAYLNKGAKY